MLLDPELFYRRLSLRSLINLYLPIAMIVLGYRFTDMENLGLHV